MVSGMKDYEVETLLRDEARSRLPLARQLLIYLDPFALFKDATRGPARSRELALAYNRAMRWMLLPYIRRWVAIAASLGLLIAPAEAAAKELTALPVAAVALGCCIALTVAATTVAVYLLLGRKP